MRMFSYPAGAIVGGRTLTERTIMLVQPVIIEDVQHGVEIFDSWSPQELAAIGLKKYVEEALPEDYFPGTPHDEETATEVQRTFPNKTPDLSAMREKKRQLIQAEKVRVRDGGVRVDGVLYDTDASAMSAYTRSMVFKFGPNPAAVIPEWKASDGIWVEMNMPLMQKLIAAGATQEQAVFAWQAAQEAALSNAQTVVEIEAVETTYRA